MNNLPILLAVLSIAAAIFSLANPARVLLVYVVSRPLIQPFIFMQYTLGGIPYALIWALFLPILYAFHIFWSGWKVLCYRSIPLLLILGLSLLSLTVTVSLDVSIEGIVKIVCAILAYGAAYNIVRSVDAADRIIRGVVFSAIGPLLFGFYQQATGNFAQIHSSVTDRVNSVFGVGNAYGIYLTITMCATIMLLLQQDLSKRARLFYVAMLAGMCASQVFALNRGTWIALVIGIAVAVVPYRRKVKLRWFIIAGTAIAIAFSGIIVKRLTETTYRYDGTEANTFQGRIDHWNHLLPQIMERPVLGHGIGTTGEIPGSKQPHNDYLRFAMDIGVAGALIYMYFLGSLALFYLRRIKFSRGALLWRYNFPMGVLTVYFIIISSTQNITQSFINFGFFLMLSGAVVKLNLLQPAQSPSTVKQRPKGLLIQHRQRLQSST